MRYHIGQSITVTTCPPDKLESHTTDSGRVIGHPFHGRPGVVHNVRPQDFDLDRNILCQVYGEKGLLRFRADELSPRAD